MNKKDFSDFYMVKKSGEFWVNHYWKNFPNIDPLIGIRTIKIRSVVGKMRFTGSQYFEQESYVYPDWQLIGRDIWSVLNIGNFRINL
jgi:hypothetical protein